MTTSYEVQVDTLPVRIVWHDGRSEEVELYLHRDSRHHAGPEVLLERLNDPEASFLPVRAGGGVQLLHLRWIAYLERRGEAPEAMENEEVGAPRFHVELELAAGEVLTGDLSEILPEAQRRVSDLLNRDDRRFLLLLSGGSTLYVQRNAVVRARELAAGAAPS